MTMKITFCGPQEKRRRIITALKPTIMPYVNGNGVQYVEKESAELDIQVEGAELIASYRLQAMLLEALPRVA